MIGIDGFNPENHINLAPNGGGAGGQGDQFDSADISTLVTDPRISTRYGYPITIVNQDVLPPDLDTAIVNNQGDSINGVSYGLSTDGRQYIYIINPRNIADYPAISVLDVTEIFEFRDVEKLNQSLETIASQLFFEGDLLKENEISNLRPQVIHDLRNAAAHISITRGNVSASLTGGGIEKSAATRLLHEYFGFLSAYAEIANVLKSDTVTFEPLPIGAIYARLKTLCGPDNLKVSISYAEPWLDDLKASKLTISVLQELMVNARKYRLRNVESQIHYNVRIKDGIVEVTVFDNGIGIDGDTLPKIFEKKYRGATAMLNVPGSGMGLNQVLQTVISKNGAVLVTSKHHDRGEFNQILIKTDTSADSGVCSEYRHNVNSERIHPFLKNGKFNTNFVIWIPQENF